MQLSQRLLAAAQALMGVTEMQARTPIMTGGVDIDDSAVTAARQAIGGQLQPLPTTRPRWYLADLETLQYEADGGNLQGVGQLHRSMRRDGMIGGLLNTRTSGLVALPKRYRGDEEVIADLRADNGSRTKFDEMVPPAELARLAADGTNVGVGVGLLMPVVNRPHPVMIRLDPEFLYYKWNEDRWYYRSITGMLAVTPGDGRWVLHVPGGAYGPWNDGLWPATGRAFIIKEHAILNRGNYSGKLANPARVAHAPLGASDEERAGFLGQLIRWGVNTVFSLPVGWEVDILESNGRGYEVFRQEEESSNNEAMIAIAGQVVTTTGGTGFANADIHRTIRSDLIKQTSLSLAQTINTQVLVPWQMKEHPGSPVEKMARVEWDTDPPKDRKIEAEALSAVGEAITTLRDALKGKSDSAAVPGNAPFGAAPTAPTDKPGDGNDPAALPATPPVAVAPPPDDDTGLELDVEELCNRFGIPIKGKAPSKDPPDTDTMPEEKGSSDGGGLVGPK